MQRRQTAAEIESEAARWTLRLDREGHTEQTAAELEAWLADDPRRQGALLQAEATWALLDRGRLLKAGAAVPSQRLPRRALFAGLGAAMAAGLVAAVMVDRPERFDTAVGEVRRVPLGDGSTAAINTDSAVAVTMTGAVRRVRLDRGEVWFQVARDESRPFVVEAGPVRARAVGTAFSVRRHKDGADIMVTEGVVKIWVKGGEARAVEVRAGSKAFLSYVGHETSRRESAEDIDRELAWRAGRIDLAGETLEAAAHEFNRYNSIKLEVAPSLASERLYGVFRVDDPEGFAAAVGASLRADVRTTATAIVITPS